MTTHKQVHADDGNSALGIEYWPIDRPQPYANNPRTIPPSAIAKVARSIAEFGFRQPIVVDDKDIVIVGHVRLAAAKQLDLTSVPVHVAGGSSAAQVKAYRLADNGVPGDRLGRYPAGARAHRLWPSAWSWTSPALRQTDWPPTWVPTRSA